MPLVSTTWRPCLLCGLLLASKVWQDISSWNSEIATIYPQYSLQAVNRLERIFCEVIIVLIFLIHLIFLILILHSYVYTIFSIYTLYKRRSNGNYISQAVATQSTTTPFALSRRRKISGATTTPCWWMPQELNKWRNAQKVSSRLSSPSCRDHFSLFICPSSVSMSTTISFHCYLLLYTIYYNTIRGKYDKCVD